MPAIVRPERKTTFSDHPSRNVRPDLLDIQIHNLIEAIASTQAALEDIRRDDGKLKSGSVGPDQLAARLRHSRTEIDDIESKIIQTAAAVSGTASQVAIVTRDLNLRAQDAETAAFAAVKSLAGVERKAVEAHGAYDDAEGAAERAEYSAVEAENAANYAEAQTDNAIAAKDEALQWAEYLAGPVVDSDKAPAYIAGSIFPHGLYYQPVEGFGGNAGLWSAKWWAVYAAQLVGAWNFYYLGAWDHDPVPGETNPATGIKVPNPMAIGSFYYNTTTGQLRIWDGIKWKSPYALASGVASRFAYQAVAGQTKFFGPDYFTNTPDVDTSPSDVHLNGVKLVETIDFTVDSATSVLTLAVGATAGSMLQWDLLVPPDKLVPGAVHTFKVMLNPPQGDGVNTAFTMTYHSPVSDSTQPLVVTDGSQLQVLLDGIVQEPGVDYMADGDQLDMTAPPPQNSHFWIVWFSNAALTT